MLDIRRIREQFPITRQRFQVLGQPQPKPLIYMDHGASTHPPTPVLDTYKDFLEHSYANVHRGRHYLSEMATDRFGTSQTTFVSSAGVAPRTPSSCAATPPRPSISPPTSWHTARA
jgi:cysteine desulfurase/selenocysteine lyase